MNECQSALDCERETLSKTKQDLERTQDENAAAMKRISVHADRK